MQTLPVSNLALSMQNVRTNVADATDIADLKASIIAHGLLNPLVVTVNGKKHMVVAGGRRFRALYELIEEGQLAQDFAVPVQIVDSSEAEEISLVENFVRKAMRPYEIYRAFKLTQDAKPGTTVEQLAARFGITTARAARILRLGNLLPEVFDLYATGRLSDEQAQAFAATDNHEAQARALATFQRTEQDWNRQPRDIRRWLGMGDRDHEQLLKLVGREEYEAAGGVIESDLFSDDVRVAHPELLAELAEIAKRAIAAKTLANLGRDLSLLLDKPRDASGYISYRLEVRARQAEPGPEAAARLAELDAIMQDEDIDELAFKAADAEYDAIMNALPLEVPDYASALHVDDYGCVTFWRDEVAQPEAKAESKAEAEDTPAEDKLTVSAKALDVMAMMRRELLAQRTASDFVVQSDAQRLLVFLTARHCFMGARNHDARGWSTVLPLWQDAAWMQEPDFFLAYGMFAKENADAIAAEMIGNMTVAKHGGEKSAYIEWLAGLSKPVAWRSTPEFWEMFNKKQTFAMLDEVCPSFRRIYSNAKQGEVRRKAHAICTGDIDLKTSPLDAAEVEAAMNWTPTWLRFAADGEPA